MTQKIFWISLAVLIFFILDRILKKLFLVKILIAQKFGFFNFYFYPNPKLVFDLPADKFLTIFLTVFLAGFLVFKLKEAYLKKELVPLTIYALIVAGAASNIFDRVFYGFVIDFMYIQLFPIFNVADTAISIGAVALFVYLMKDYFPKKKTHHAVHKK